MINVVEVYEDGILIGTEEIEIPDPAPEPLPEPDVLIASVAQMTPDQKADLRAALGL